VQDCTVYHDVIDESILERPLYELVYNTGPGCVIHEFMPFRGITRYEYDHHGALDHSQYDGALNLKRTVTV